MSEIFSPFVPSAGTGPDAAIGEPRIVELKNGQLEADGRIVASTGYSEAYPVQYPVISPELIKGGWDGEVVQTSEITTSSGQKEVALHVLKTGVSGGSATHNSSDAKQFSLSPLVAMGITEIDSTYGHVYQETMTTMSSGDLLLAYQLDTADGLAFWVIFGPDGVEKTRGELGPGILHNAADYFSVYVTGDYLVSLRVIGASTSTVTVYEFIGGSGAPTQRAYRTVAKPAAASSVMYIEYAYEDDAGYLQFMGIADGGTYVVRNPIKMNKTTFALSTGTVHDTGSLSRATAADPANRRLPRLSKDPYSSDVYHIKADISANFFYVYKNGATLEYTSTEFAPIDMFWPVISGIWGGVLPGFLGPTSPSYLEYGEWGGIFNNGPNALLPTSAPAEFSGPFVFAQIPLPDTEYVYVTFAFGGGAGAPDQDNPTHGKGVWIFGADQDSRMIGEVHLDDFTGFAFFTSDNILILLGKKVIANASQTLAIERWKLQFRHDPEPTELTSRVYRSNSGVIVTGAIPVEIDGETPLPRFGFGPAIPPKAPTSGTSGTFLYCYHWCAIDKDGHYVNSPVSPVTTGSYTGGNLRIYDDPLVRTALPDSSLASGKLFCKVFSTEDGGTTFYLVKMFPIDDFSGGAYNFTVTVDSAAEILYTQGTAGALSGRVETTGTPPCQFYHRGNRRCVAGGLWRPNTIQFSDWYVYGEITPWPIGEQWIVDLNSRVTGVGEIDGTPVTFCENGVYFIGGEGPDAMGEGEFDSIQKVSNIGCATPGSVVECPLGWFYQGLDGQLYLLASGGNVSCVSLSARSLASGGTDVNYFSPSALVRHSVYDEANHRVIFVIGDPSVDGPTALRSVSLDVRNMQFSIETTGNAIPTGDTVAVEQPIVGPMWIDNGKLTCVTVDATDDSLVLVQQRTRGEAGWWLGHGDLVADTDQSLWRRLTFSTSNLTPWGKAGWGRVREVSFAVTQDSASETLDAPYSVLISARTDGDTLSSEVIDSTLRDSVVEFVPMYQKCSDLRLTVTDQSSAPLVWHGVNVSTTSAGRTRVR